MKKTNSNSSKNVTIESANSNHVSMSEKLFFTYADELVKAKLDLVGKTGQMLAAIKAFVPQNIIDVQRVEYMTYEQILLQATEYYEKILRAEVLKVLEYYHNHPDYAAATIISSICVYILDEEKWIIKLFQELINDPFAKLFFKKHAELGRQFYQDIECASDCVVSLKGKLLALETQIKDEFEDKDICLVVASELSHNLRLIIKALDNKESSELWRGAKSNLQIFEMLKEGVKPLPTNFKIEPASSKEGQDVYLRNVRELIEKSQLQIMSQTKEESIYPEFRDQAELDDSPKEPLRRSDPNCKIRIVGPHGEKLVN
jgi:hypothetical protein